MKKNFGFTLIEMIFYIAIISALSFAGFLIMGIVNDTKLRNKAISEVNYNGLFISEALSRGVRTALAIDCSSSDKIFLTMSDVKKNPTVFTFSDSSIYMQEGMGEKIKLNSQDVAIKSLMFNDFSVFGTCNNIQALFAISYNGINQSLKYNYSKNFYATASMRK